MLMKQSRPLSNDSQVVEGCSYEFICILIFLFLLNVYKYFHF